MIVPAPPHAEARNMDPAELVIGHNVRPEEQINLDAHLKEVASIRMLGVRDPILAERGPDGQIVVLDGQVRALIASLPYAAAGFAIATADPVYLDHDNYVAAEDLVTADQVAVTESGIWADPARWVVALERIEDAEVVDEDTGQVIDPDTVDFDADGDTPPAVGLRYGLIHRDVWLATYFLAVDQLEPAELQRRTTDPDLTGDGTDPTEALARAEEEHTAAARRGERRRVIELNKRGAAAEARRIEFLARLLSGRTLPAGAAQFVAESLAREAGLLSGTRARAFAMQRLGLTTSAELIERATSGTTTEGWRFVLGLVLAAHKFALGKDSWRQHRWLRSSAPHYLHHLAEVGEAKGSSWSMSNSPPPETSTPTPSTSNRTLTQTTWRAIPPTMPTLGRATPTPHHRDSAQQHERATHKGRPGQRWIGRAAPCTTRRARHRRGRFDEQESTCLPI
ncbi:ParB/Srx family N-terminal domain-containing protein [Nocardia sp. NPDC055053]